MQLLELDRVKERLLKEGVARRHVHRYVRELREHYQDTLREELANGKDRTTAERAASARLGEEDNLVKSVLVQPGLRSITSRYPRLIFGLAPVVFWIGAFWLLAFMMVPAIFGAANITNRGPQPAWAFLMAYAVFILSARIVPVALGLAALTLCARQRLSPQWPIVGVTLVAIISGTLNVSMALPTGTDIGWIGISTSLLPFFFSHVALGEPDAPALAAGLARAGGMLAISVIPYVMWRRFLRRATALRISLGP